MWIGRSIDSMQNVPNDIACATQGCNYWTWFNANDPNVASSCFLYNGVDGPQPSLYAFSGCVDPNDPLCQTGTGNIQDRTMWIGRSIDSMQNVPNDIACATQGCNYWTWFNANDPNVASSCFLYNMVDGPQPSLYAFSGCVDPNDPLCQTGTGNIQDQTMWIGRSFDSMQNVPND